MKKILIVGCGFSGAVLAREIAENTKSQVTIIEKKNHIGGNCHTYLDKKKNILIHSYGPHIFHTSDEQVWKYMNQFGKFNNFINRIKILNTKGTFSMPINLLTINQFFKKNLNPSQAKKFIKSIKENISNPKNFEEKAFSLIGKKIYKNFFYGYTSKQWGVSPKKIPVSVLKRLPMRFDYNDNYYNHKYQGIPESGYTEIIKKIIKKKSIKLLLSTPYNKDLEKIYDQIIFTGPIDEYFNYEFGRLNYRTVYWKKKTFSSNDVQGNALINYNDKKIPYTRTIEYQHFNPEKKNKGSVLFYEYSKKTGVNDIPYYPVRFKSDKIKLDLYQKKADKLKNVHFIGRLGTYRYLDMHVVIKESMDFFQKYKKIFI